ncbi:MAG: type I restriction endonuclease, partial [Blastocatellia bacterium]
LAMQGAGNRNDDEKLLHNLIFQQGSDRPDQSDLWLFNEEFVYYSGSSNTQLQSLKFKGENIIETPLSDEKEEYRKSLGEDRLQKRPDILLFPNEGKCIIIEFKNPSENVSDHLHQINKYASLLRNLTKDQFAVDTFFGYLIGQSIDPRDVRSADADFKRSEHFDYMFRPAKTVAGDFGRSDGSIYTEVLKYSTLLKRASTRNKIFLEKLGVRAKP